MGDHSLEDYPIMLEKIMNKKTVNSFPCVPKTDMNCVKNLQVVTRYGIRTRLDKKESEPIKYI